MGLVRGPVTRAEPQARLDEAICPLPGAVRASGGPQIAARLELDMLPIPVECR
jgi:hypothetical protein